MARLMGQFKNPDRSAKKKLVIDSDDIGMVYKECIRISDTVGMPVLFDEFHHLVK